MANETLSTERLEEILRGTEGVTPGPWQVEKGNEGALALLAAQELDGFGMVIANVYSWPKVVVENAAHIARLDPQTIASIVSELLALRKADASNRGLLRKAGEALDAAAERFAQIQSLAINSMSITTPQDLIDWQKAIAGRGFDAVSRAARSLSSQINEALK